MSFSQEVSLPLLHQDQPKPRHQTLSIHMRVLPCRPLDLSQQWFCQLCGSPACRESSLVSYIHLLEEMQGSGALQGSTSVQVDPNSNRLELELALFPSAK